MRKEKQKKPPPDPTIPSEEELSEGNWADKIIKELFQKTLPSFLTDILHLPVGKYKTAYLELQRTIEKRTDFLGKLYANGQEKTIAHLEVQTDNFKKMVNRELLYAALILDRYPNWELLQYVFYIGKSKPTMPTQLIKNGINFSFKLIWIKNIYYKEFLKTGKPELMLLAALAGYGKKKPKEVILEVVNEVKKCSNSSADFEKHIEQLHILTNIHNLHQIFEDIMTSISHLVNVEKDPFYKKGIIQGELKGKLEGKLEGKLGRSLEIATNLVLKSDHTDTFIADISGVPEKIVAKIRKIIQDFPNNFREKIAEIHLNQEDLG
jgi:hypothetical protein